MSSGGSKVSQKIDETLLGQAPNYFIDMYNMIGTTEYLPKDKKKDNPVVLNMFKTIKYPGSPRKVPWCAIGLCHFLEKRGWKSPKSAAARSFMPWGKNVDTSPRIGDICVKWRGTHDDGVHGHVFLYIKQVGNFVYGLGCNQGDSISIEKFPIKQMLGYRRPRNVPIVSKTVLSGSGSAATGVAAEGVKQLDPIVNTPSAPISTTPIDNATNAVEAVRPLGDLLPTIGIILTIASIALALLAIYWRIRDYNKEGL